MTEPLRMRELAADPRILDALNSQASDIDMDGIAVRVCSLDHLLEMKRASERPRDRDDLEALEATQGVKDQGS